MSLVGYKPTWAGFVEAQPRPNELHALITPSKLLHRGAAQNLYLTAYPRLGLPRPRVLVGKITVLIVQNTTKIRRRRRDRR